MLDVLYVVAKTYKDEQYLNTNKFDDPNEKKEFVKQKSNKRRRSKRSLYDYANNHSYHFSNATHDGSYAERSSKSHNSIFDSYKNVFSTSKAQPKRANLFNVPVDDMFLGTFAIPTNQAIAVSQLMVSLLIKNLESVIRK